MIRELACIMAVYLIDYENVSFNGLEGIENLTSEDTVHIFYSENANKMTFELHHKISSSHADFHYYKADVGKKNALDFQLSTYLGYLIALNPEKEYIIVSNDETFSFLIKFWIKRNFNVKRACNLLQEEQLAEQQRQEAEELLHMEEILREKVLQVLPECSDDVKEIIGYIQRYKTKQGINNALVKRYKSERAGEIYKAIKPFIAEKKGR